MACSTFLEGLSDPKAYSSQCTHEHTHATDLQLILGGCIQHHKVLQEGAKVWDHTLRSEVRISHTPRTTSDGSTIPLHFPVP